MDFMNDFEESPYIYEKSDIDNISNPNNLYESFKKCRKGFQWKESVQKYELNLLTNITNAYHSLENKTYKLSDPYEFILNERGHNRYIKALSIVDRVIQRSFNDNVLNPAISNHIIYDNGASQKGKGVKFSRDRFKYHLRNTYNKYGYNAYVLLIDFSKYFDNILHEELLNQFKPLMNESEYWFLDKTFHTFDIDVSYMSDEEYLNSRDDLFNSLEYCNIPKEYLTGEKILRKSIGIGNQSSQASGIFYPHEIDNYITAVRGYGDYGRYMDDTYIFAATKEELEELLKDLTEKYRAIGIHVNKKKTRIQSIKYPISYLKIEYSIKETGRIIERVPNRVFKRERKRIESFKKIYDKGIMSVIDILQCYLSWEGSYKKFDSKRQIYLMNLFFKDTFGIMRIDNLNEILHYLLKWERKEKYSPEVAYGI